MKKKILFSFAFLFLVVCVLIFRPVPIVQEDKALVVSGVVEKIRLTGGNDFLFKLKGDPTRYYINRGIEAGLNYEEFEQTVLNQFIVVKYPDYWTPLDWSNRVRHISKVELDGEALYNELK